MSFTCPLCSTSIACFRPEQVPLGPSALKLASTIVTTGLLKDGENFALVL